MAGREISSYRVTLSNKEHLHLNHTLIPKYSVLSLLPSGLPQDHFPTEKIQLCLEQSDNVSKTRNKARRSVSFILIHTSVALLCLPFTKETGCQSVIHLPDQYLLWPYRASVLPLVLMAAMVKTVASMVETYRNNCSNREIQTKYYECNEGTMLAAKTQKQEKRI